MALDQIKKVAEAEAKFKSEKEACLQKGQEEISKAKEESGILIAKAISEAQEQVRQLLAQVEQEAKSANQTSLDQASARCNTQKQSASEKLDLAANLITERVVNSQWQS